MSKKCAGRGGGIIGKIELPGEAYRRLSIVGKGASSVVCLVEEISSGKFFAMKIATGDGGNLRREAAVLGRLCHPGIPKVKEFFADREKSCLVMEYVKGKSVGQKIREGAVFSRSEILQTGIALSEILCYLHAQEPPVFYRDLKPDNVVISEKGTVYLVDFGSAGTKREGVEVRYGTRGYAAPEQYRGRCGEQSDLYGLGALLGTMAEHGKKYQNRDLRRVAARCMREDPKERYASAKKVQKVLRHLKRKTIRKAGIVFAAFFLFFALENNAWEEEGERWFCGDPVQKECPVNYEKALESFQKAPELSRAGRIEQEIVEYCLADPKEKAKRKLEPLLIELLEETRAEEDQKRRCRRYLALAGMYFSFSEELEQEKGEQAVPKGIEILKEAAGEEPGLKWEKIIWQRLADACYLLGQSGDGEEERRWCRESLQYYELLFQEEDDEKDDAVREKNLLRAAETALQLGKRQTAGQYLKKAEEIPGVKEDVFYQRIRKRWEEKE